mmetsp:Transcript_4957/g.8497  ORF Transcript_4957/g.8497 Transcript_4957/m.8497 type:complete len:217 (+) Transcript_4957:1349-1999(+)
MQVRGGLVDVDRADLDGDLEGETRDHDLAVAHGLDDAGAGACEVEVILVKPFSRAARLKRHLKTVTVLAANRNVPIFAQIAVLIPRLDQQQHPSAGGVHHLRRLVHHAAARVHRPRPHVEWQWCAVQRLAADEDLQGVSPRDFGGTGEDIVLVPGYRLLGVRLGAVGVSEHQHHVAFVAGVASATEVAVCIAHLDLAIHLVADPYAGIFCERCAES